MNNDIAFIFTLINLNNYKVNFLVIFNQIDTLLTVIDYCMENVIHKSLNRLYHACKYNSEIPCV